MTDQDAAGEIAPFTLRRLTYRIMARWKVATIIIACSVLFCIVRLHFLQPSYTIRMQVVAAESGQTAPTDLGAGAALLGQFTGNAGGQQSNFELYLAGLQSYETARLLAQRPNIMHVMFASEWSERDKAWRQPASLSGKISGAIQRLFGIYVAPWQPPDAIRVEEYLQAGVGISRNILSPVVTITVQSGNQKFGVDLLNALHDDVDGNLRHRALDRVSGYVNYLNGLIGNATVVEYRQALAETIVQQEKMRMVAASGAPYAADLFTRPTSLRIPTWPNGRSLLFISILIGILLALAEAVLYDRVSVYRSFIRSAAWKPGERRS